MKIFIQKERLVVMILRKRIRKGQKALIQTMQKMGYGSSIELKPIKTYPMELEMFKFHSEGKEFFISKSKLMKSVKKANSIIDKILSLQNFDLKEVKDDQGMKILLVKNS